MNETPLPLRPDQVDELLSAEFDGEFDAAAADLGFDPAAARAQLDATAGVAERRQALGAARALIADVPELDELTAARLRTSAIEESAEERAEAQGRRHRGRRLGIAGGIAAALLLVVGVVAAVQNSSSSTRQVGRAAPAGDSQSESLVDAGVANDADVDFGAFADVDELIARAGTTAATDLVTVDGTPELAGPPNAGAPQPDSRANTANDRTYRFEDSVTACAAAASEQAGTSADPTLYGRATVAGNPVLVWVFGLGEDATIVVLDTECRVVSEPAG